MKRKTEEKSVNQRGQGGVREISYETKLKALGLFRSGCGYKKVSAELGLKVYTVRDWGRRFHKGDCEWAMPKDGKPRKKYDKEIKKLAIAAYGMGTMSLTEICSLYSIPRKDTLVIWIREKKRKRENQAYGDNARRAVSGEAAEMEGCGDLCPPALSGAGTGERGDETCDRGNTKKKHISRSPAARRRERTDHQGSLCCSRHLEELVLQIEERPRKDRERHGARRANEEDTTTKGSSALQLSIISIRYSGAESSRKDTMKTGGTGFPQGWPRMCWAGNSPQYQPLSPYMPQMSHTCRARTRDSSI